MQTIKSIPAVAGLIFFIVFNALFLLWSFWVWGNIWVLLSLPPFVLSVSHLVQTLRDGIIVDHTGISGKIKEQAFHFRYHEITAVNIVEEHSKKTLLIVAGYQSHSIRIKNAKEMRDAILHNMALAKGETIPPPSPLSVLRTRELSLEKKFKKSQKWILIVFFLSIVSFLPFTWNAPFPFSSLVGYSIFEIYSPSWGIFMISLYFLFWAFSKRWHLFFLLSMVLLLLEILIFPFMFLSAITDIANELPILLFLFFFYALPHIWVLFRLIRGTVFWRSLRLVRMEKNALPQENIVVPNSVNLNHTKVSTSFVTQNAIYQPTYTAIPMDDTLFEKLNTLLRHGNTIYHARVLILEDIPSQKLERVITHFARDFARDETAIALFDNTLRGSGKSGFLLTNKHLYTKSDFEKPVKSYIKNISHITAPTMQKKDTYKIIIHLHVGGQIYLGTALRDQYKSNAAHTLNEAIHLLQKHEEGLSLE